LPNLKHVNVQTLQDDVLWWDALLIQTALFDSAKSQNEMKDTEDRHLSRPRQPSSPSQRRGWGSEDSPRKFPATSEDDDLCKKHLTVFYSVAFGTKTTLDEVEEALESLDDAIKSHDNSNEALGKLNRLRTNLAFRRLCYTTDNPLDAAVGLVKNAARLDSARALAEIGRARNDRRFKVASLALFIDQWSDEVDEVTVVPFCRLLVPFVPTLIGEIAALELGVGEISVSGTLTKAHEQVAGETATAYLDSALEAALAAVSRLFGEARLRKRLGSLMRLAAEIAVIRGNLRNTLLDWVPVELDERFSFEEVFGVARQLLKMAAKHGVKVQTKPNWIEEDENVTKNEDEG
jgi:hypothetical protein